MDEIYDTVRKDFPKISLATVYRNVEQLCQMGKIWNINSGQTPARYDGNMVKHSHITCQKCGCLEDVWLTKNLAGMIDFNTVINNFTVTDYKVDFYGICSPCSLSS